MTRHPVEHPGKAGMMFVIIPAVNVVRWRPQYVTEAEAMALVALGFRRRGSVFTGEYVLAPPGVETEEACGAALHFATH